MLFNSYGFLFVFLPVAVAGYYAARRLRSVEASFAWLLLCSYVFYGWWNAQYVLLLAATTLFNFFVGRWAGRLWVRDRTRSRRVVLAGVAANLAALIYFKYTGLLVGTADDLLGLGLAVPAIVLPLGISFFTFQKIAYLSDIGRDGVAEPRLLRYALFVSFFPQLIAGPIVHPRDVLPQFDRLAGGKVPAEMLASGITILAIGLFKKTVLADSLSPLVGQVFDAAAHGAPVGALDAWGAAVAYALQIYFDFSGYSDMAIGLALLFGIRLPINFNSPYQAASIIDFWRRWHMTLSQFLRDYLYIPLGGNRHGKTRQYVNLMITMVLGGLWHGANWTFAVWGALHGLYLLVNHLARALRPADATPAAVTVVASRLLTFAAVVVAWVFFRAPDMDTAIHLLAAMTLLPAGTDSVVFALSGGNLILVVIPLAIAWLFPNTQTIMNYRPWVDRPHDRGGETLPVLRWRPTAAWSIATVVLFALGIWNISAASEFIYFQF
jgi:D-alanyl-lipoteichoic acid acyltransferase DltB (MBOAT superfamily)